MGRKGDGCVFRPKGRRFYYIKFTIEGRTVRESAETENKEEATERLRRRIAEVGSGISPDTHKVKFAQLAKNLVRHYEINNMKSTRNLIIRLDRHILPFFGRMKASRIKPEHIKEFVSRRIQAGGSNSEINRELAIIKRAFTLGMEDGDVQLRPHIKLLKEPPPRSGFFEEGEVYTLLKHLPHDIGQLVLFYYYTGWRRSEATNLRWANISFERQEIRLFPSETKNGKGRVFPMTPHLLELLTEQREHTDKLEREKDTLIPWVFHRNGHQIIAFNKDWEKATKAAGLAGRIVHDFRRTAVRNLLRQGVTERQAMQMIGHQTRSIFDRYHIISESDIADACKKMGEFDAKVLRKGHS